MKIVQLRRIDGMLPRIRTDGMLTYIKVILYNNILNNLQVCISYDTGRHETLSIFIPRVEPLRRPKVRLNLASHPRSSTHCLYATLTSTSPRGTILQTTLFHHEEARGRMLNFSQLTL